MHCVMGDMWIAWRGSVGHATVCNSSFCIVLLAPHHGSGTSSTPQFLDAVAPKMAVFQVGYRNRYRHPKPSVLERYHERGIAVLRSDRSGAVSVHIDHAGIKLKQACETPRYWSSQRCDQTVIAIAKGPE